MWRERLQAATSTAVPGTLPERWIFWMLLALAAALRMWDLPHIPFMHDEISALVRLYPTLGETIHKGVIELDTHPPGVQVFEWLWTRAFGSEEWVIKLPFILMSIAALFFIHRFASAWTNATAALIVVALLATLQYFVLYGQIARPYAFGLFTTTLMADQLTRYIAHGRRSALVWMTIGCVLSCYAHHFALMQAALTIGAGFFLITPEQRKAYLIACGAAVLAYLPNVPIFLHQLSQGGLSEWLQAPGRYWLSDYAWWIAHCSWLMAGVLIVLMVLSVAQRISVGPRKSPFLWLALLWGLVPLVIGYGYSVWRAPVIQYSVLIFSFPYLLILLLSGIQQMKWSKTALVTGTVAAASVFTLITVRLHYELFYRSKYEAFIREGMKAQATYGKDNCLVLLDAPDHVIRFYMERWGISEEEFPYVQVRGREVEEWLAILMASHASTLFYGASNGAWQEVPGIVRSFFPSLLVRHDLVDGQILLFTSKHTSDRIDDLRFASGLKADVVVPHFWHLASGVIEVDTMVMRSAKSLGLSGLDFFYSLTGREFGIEFNAPLDSLGATSFAMIEATARLAYPSESAPILVAELKDGDSTLTWRANTVIDPRYDLWISTTIPLIDVPLRGRSPVLKCYIWNRNKAEALISSVQVLIREGNPVQYAFFQPIRGEWKYR